MVVFEIPYVCVCCLSVLCCVVLCCVVLFACLFVCFFVCWMIRLFLFVYVRSFAGGGGLAKTCRFVVETNPGMMTEIVG